MGGATKILLISIALFVTGCEGSSQKLRPFSQVVVEKTDDTVEVTLSAMVDLLFVVDGSGSMGSHQENILANFDAFLNELSKARYLDYRVAVTIAGCTRDRGAFPHYQSGVCHAGVLHSPVAGPGPYFVERTDPDALTKIKERLHVGIRNDAVETFFGPVLSALTAPVKDRDMNRGFLRKGSYFVPIFVTDTDDQTPAGVNSLLSPEDFHRQLSAIVGHPDRILAYSAHIPSELGATPAECPRDPTGQHRGAPVRIEEFLDLANGSFFNICSPHFGKELVQVAQDIVDQIEPAIFLDDRPYPPSIQLSVGGKEIPNDFVKGWAYDPVRNAIVLGTEVELDEYSTNAIQVRYTRSNTF